MKTSYYSQDINYIGSGYLPAADEGFAPSDEPTSLGAADKPRVPGLVLVILFSSIFLQRFAIPIGTDGIAVGIMINLVAVVLLLLQGEVQIAPLRMALVSVFAAYSFAEVIFSGPYASPNSAALVVAIYLPFAFTLRAGRDAYVSILRAFQTLMAACAALGIMQFLLQFFVHGTWLYTFQGLLPDSVLLKGFATYLPIRYGSPLHRSNGFFMLEPSIFSQFLAIAIIIELVFFKVRWRLIVFCTALMFAYSGTGLIVLGLVPFILLRKRSLGMIVALVLFGALAVATSQTTHLTVIQQRVSEFDQGDSSAHARFIAPIKMLERFVVPKADVLLFGAGPGAIKDFIAEMPYETHDPLWAKLLIEYGVVGFILFTALYITAVLIGAPSAWISAALTIGFLSFGGELLDPRLSALALMFCVLPARSQVPYDRSSAYGAVVHTGAQSFDQPLGDAHP